MNDGFSAAFDHILAWEGGYVNHPKDPGGETNFGICKRAYPTLDIKGLTREQAATLYRRDYWDRLRLNELPAGLALLAFDCAVNQGNGTARRILAITRDITEFAAQRAYRYALLDRLDDTFALGWMRRLFATYKRALEMTP